MPIVPAVVAPSTIETSRLEVLVPAALRVKRSLVVKVLLVNVTMSALAVSVTVKSPPAKTRSTVEGRLTKVANPPPPRVIVPVPEVVPIATPPVPVPSRVKVVSGGF